MRGTVLRRSIASVFLSGLLAAVAGCTGSPRSAGTGSTPPTAPQGASVTQSHTPALPPPTELVVTKATPFTLAFRWQAPAGKPQPVQYRILLNGKAVASLRGSFTSYQATGLSVGTSYPFQVEADWSADAHAL